MKIIGYNLQKINGKWCLAGIDIKHHRHEFGGFKDLKEARQEVEVLIGLRKRIEVQDGR